MNLEMKYMHQDIIMAYLEKIANKKGEVINEQTDLFGSLILDSFEVISLLSYLQEKFSINFSEEDLDFRNFQTVDNIVSWLDKKIKERG